MRHPNRYITSLLLASILAVPVSIMAAPTPQSASIQVRVYDKNHKDYHNWDDRENHAWAAYLSDNHRKSHEFSKAKKKEQSQYWTWRHSHPDRD
jgi:hypothetical protein